MAIPCRPESRGWLRITSPDLTRPSSIQPTVVSGNTNATATMIGEKGADMILRAA